MASLKVMQNRIAKFVEKLAEDSELNPNLEVIESGIKEDPSEQDVPYTHVQTDYRIIYISVTEEGEVDYRVRMRRGAGSEKDFNKRADAFETIRKEVKKKKYAEYSKKESFVNGWIKLTNEVHILTFTFNQETGEVEFKERARRGTKKEDKVITVKENVLPSDELSKSGTIVLNEMSTEQKPKRHRRTKAEMEAARAQQVTGKLESVAESTVPASAASDKQVTGKLEPAPAATKKPKKLKDDPYICDGLTVADLHFVEENSYEEWPQGAVVELIYSGKRYTVEADMKNVIEVSSADSGYQTIARSDLKLVG